MEETKDAGDAGKALLAEKKQIINNFSASIDVLEEDLKRMLKTRTRPNLTLDEKIKLDTYLSYVTTTLYFMNIKVQGVDTTKHPIMDDLQRNKEAIARDKAIVEALNAPRLDVAAAKRFFAAGLHIRYPDNDTQTKSTLADVKK